MLPRKHQNLDAISLDRVSDEIVEQDKSGHSDLFVYLSQNRSEFAARRHDHTWSEWATAFEKLGIRTNAPGPVLASTLKQTWWRVRKAFGEPVGEPILGAEKAKAKRRRKPPSQVKRVADPIPLKPGEVAPGVRLVNQPAATSDGTELVMAKLKGLQGWMEN